MNKAVFSVFLLTWLLASMILPARADDPPPIPTPLPREYTQDAIGEMMEIIETRYGIGFAVPEEWIPGTAAEVIQFVDFLHGILEALDVAAYYLFIYGEAPEDSSPPEFFRQHFDRAAVQIDRVSAIDGGFIGNTLPVLEDGETIGYVIQLAPAATNGTFILPHELGHVLDGLLNDQPHQQFIDELGGEWTPDAWIPGLGYAGNENLFPRAVAGPNEDFADTFSNMLLGRLSPESVPVRYEFMLEHIPVWLEAICALPPTEVED